MTAPERDTRVSHGADVLELQREYPGPLAGSQTVAAEGALMLVGAYTAISPWVVGFFDTQPLLTMNNVILGLIVAAIGLGITGTPERSGGISWSAAPIGVWLIIATWVTTAGGPTVGVVWNNVVVGALAIILGMAVAGMVLTTRPRSRQH